MEFKKKLNLKVAGILLSGATLFGMSSDQTQEDPSPVSVSVDVPQPSVKNPFLQITYKTDTIQNRNSILLYNQNGNIFRHYKENDALYRMRMYLFVHEAWHTHNINLGFKKFNFSPAKYRNLLAHDEISANLTSLNSLILEYSLTDNKKEFLNNVQKNSKYFSFYFDEVAKGKIDPLSNDSAMIEKDYSLRINGTINTWMKRSYPSYAGRHRRMLFNYLQINGVCPEKEALYTKMLHGMYNIGGIDFWQYAKSDIEINDLPLINNLTQIRTFPNDNKLLIEDIKNYSPLIEKIIDDNDRSKAIQHLLIVAELKSELTENNYVIDNIMTTILYNKIRTRYTKDQTFSNFVMQTNNLSRNIIITPKKDVISLDEFLHRIYQLGDIDLREKITNFAYDNVPYGKNKFEKLYNDNNMFMFEWINDVPTAYVHAQPKEKITSIKPVKTVGTPFKPRRSDKQYLNIPNFNEPILVSLNEAQKQELKSIYTDFYNMPETREFPEYNIQQPSENKQDEPLIKQKNKTISNTGRRSTNINGKTH